MSRWARSGRQLAAAQRAGETNPEQVGIIERALSKVDRPGFDPAAVEAGEELLTRFAQQFGPKELKRLAAQVIDHIDPDGTLPNDQLQRDRRFLHLRQTRDGGYAGEFRLTGECGVKLTTLLGPLAKPRLNTTAGPDGQVIEQPDARHHGSGCTTPSKTCATGCSAPTTLCRTPAAPRRR